MKNTNEIFKTINEGVFVNRPMVISAKRFILKNIFENSDISTTQLLSNFLVLVKSPINDDEVVIHESVDPNPKIQRIIRNISWQLAFSQAAWSLVKSNFLIQLENTISSETPKCRWTTVIPGSGGHKGGWDFNKWQYSIPNKLILSPSFKCESKDYLIDPDLYLEYLGIKNLHEEVAQSLQYAVLCFQAELYTPSITMLFRAVEGAWIELGKALCNAVDSSYKEKVNSYKNAITNKNNSILKIMKTVIDLYNKDYLFSELQKGSGVKVEYLKDSFTWSDCVRESRNVLHYGKVSDFPNDFEKVATFLLGASVHFKRIYKLINAASKLKGV